MGALAGDTRGIALVGCGFVADFYLATMGNHPELEVLGVYDRNPDRAEACASHHGVRRYPSLEALLSDDQVYVVVNLTDPQNHYPVSRSALLANKHVYSEKPLAVTHSDAEELVVLAEERQLVFGCAPCNQLGETAQTIWRAIRRGDIGRPQLVYAELDDGALHRMPYRTWRSASGAPWPYRTEFETGCTLEHAAYYLTWLTAMFGAAEEVASFAGNIVDEVPELERPAPDFTSACLRYRCGVVARLTCSIIAPSDHSLRIVGEEGVLGTTDAWDFGSPVWIRRARPPGTPGHLAYTDPVDYPLVRTFDFRHRYDGFHRIDFARGIAEVASAAVEKRPSRLSARHALFMLDVMLAITRGERRRFAMELESIEPMEWA